jgi:hypothetical protein
MVGNAHSIKNNIGGAMFDYSNYPREVQAKFDEYFALLLGKLHWGIVLPKYFKKNQFFRNGNGYRMKCPFHIERNASMRFSSRYGIYRCFGCGESGNVYGFILRMECGDNTRAMWFIKKHFHIPLPFSRKAWWRIRRDMEDGELDWESRLNYLQFIWSRLESFEFEPFNQDAELYYGLGELGLLGDVGQVVETKKQITSQAKVIEEQSKHSLKVKRPKRLIIVRHAHYNDHYRISIRGHQQILDLIPLIKAHIDCISDRVMLITSTAPRALDTANVLRESVRGCYHEDELFWSDRGHPWDYEKALESILHLSENNRIDVAILVTHLEYADYLPIMFGDRIMGIKVNLPEIKKGQAVCCDLEAKTVKLLV